MSAFLQKFGFSMILFVVLIFSTALHTWHLGSLPKGLYNDEASIGLNAAHILQSGHDEHGTLFPIYFKAFGEYKNPLYIYVVSMLFGLFGISIESLRFTSFLFFLLFQGSLYLLLKTLYKNKWIGLLGLLFSSTYPFFFPISRLSFELISTLPLFTLALYASLKSFEEKSSWFFPVLAGICWSLCIYSYSTMRLLVPLMLLGASLLYIRKNTWRESLLLTLSLSLTLIPFLWFIFSNPAALFTRFESISYLQESTLGTLEKFHLGLRFYLSYFSPDFLLFHGDPNMRHHIGWGGMIPWSLFFLAVFGIAHYGMHFKTQKKIQHLLFLFLLLSPLPATLTEPMHALRSHILGLLLLLWSIHGMYLLYEGRKYLTSTLLGIGFLLLFITESSLYSIHYFSTYPPLSEKAMEEFGLYNALDEADKKHPHTIYIAPHIRELATYIHFYQALHPSSKTSMIIGIPENLQPPHTCTLYRETSTTPFRSTCVE